MTHLAQDATIGAGNTLDSQDGAVRVNREVHAWSTRCINVLCCYLAVGLERLKQLVGGNKATFSVTDCDGVDVAKCALGEPWRHRGSNAGANKLALVATNGVERQRWAGVVHRTNVAVRNKSQLDERLEAIANAQHKAIALLQKLADSLGNLRSAEERADKLSRSVGLVSAGETAWNHDNLALLDGLCQCICGLNNVLRCQVVDNQRGWVSARTLKGSRDVVFAVVAREYGDDDAWASRCDKGWTSIGVSCGCTVEADFLYSLVGASAVGEDLLKWALPCFLELGEVDLLATCAQDVLRRGDAQGSHAHAVDVVNGYAVCQLNDEGAVGWREERVGRNLWHQLNAQLVAQAALEESLGHAAVTWCGDGKRALGLNKGADQLICGEQGLVVGKKATLVVGWNNGNEPMTCAFELV